MLELLSIAVFAGLLVYAAATDIASLTIPNWVSIALASVFPLAALAAGMTAADIGLHLAFGLAVLAVGFFLFAANIIGGGDAKLLAAASVWTGFPGFPAFIVWTAVAGGVLALALLAARVLAKQAETHPPFLSRLLKPRGGVPYGVAIMAGGLMAIPALPFALSSLTLP
jgi:prepilin peptidase CpaA